MAALSKTVREAVQRLGPVGFVKLIARKFVKRQRYALMLREVPKVKTVASLADPRAATDVTVSDADREKILTAADRMLRDENTFFTFPYSLRAVDRPWEFDPIEKKRWPRRHYTEQKLHAEDTPGDVKIVWEINRFVDLPALAQAAYGSKDKRYAEEIQRRLLSWIDENPFAHSINWASALEIGIRILSWTFSLRLLQLAGFAVHENERIRRSVYEQLRYLSADLSIDKVIPTNHLIGEVAALFVGASLWQYPTAPMDRTIARRILETEILRQTFEDGVTREASSWYHQFVTGFFDLVDRVATFAEAPMSEPYRERLSRMKGYVGSLTVDGTLLRYGDADDGVALSLVGDPLPWLDAVFGTEGTPSDSGYQFYVVAQQAMIKSDRSALFTRGGTFGMGGAGFSSHAHDDFLSPILYLEGLPVLVDPGTFVYNGAPEERRKYRGADAHNGLVIGETTGASQRMNFGWHTVRPDANLEIIEWSAEQAVLEGSYGEWALHHRKLEIDRASASVSDIFEGADERIAHWRFHFDPRWKPVHQSEPEFHLEDETGNRLRVKLEGKFESLKVEHYDYSPSYRVRVQAFALELSAAVRPGAYSISFSLA